MTSRVRDALRQGRRDLHQEMSVPALYIVAPNATPIPCTVRPHDLPAANGKPGGRDKGYATDADEKPRLIFSTDDAPTPIRVGAIVSVEPGVAYRIGVVEPPHGITITTHVAALQVGETVGLPVPSDDDDD